MEPVSPLVGTPVGQSSSATLAANPQASASRRVVCGCGVEFSFGLVSSAQLWSALLCCAVLCRAGCAERSVVKGGAGCDVVQKSGACVSVCLCVRVSLCVGARAPALG